MQPESQPINYYTAVLQALLSDTDKFFSVSEIAAFITEKHPLIPSRAAILRAIYQLKCVPLVVEGTERRYLRCIPISVYKYKIY
jgi:hypothetical protein